MTTSTGGPGTDQRPIAGLSDDAALRIFRTMRTIRSADDRIALGLNSGEFRMTYYGVRGQEVIPAAICEHLRRDDYMVTTYRGMHDCIAKGVPLDELVAEMCGKVTGTSKGKGGPMHLSDPQSGLMVTTGVVGGGLPIAVGLALSSKLRGTDQVTVVNFGDGATSIGATHEACNLAALWDVPVVFVCQHNQYGEHTKFADYTRTHSLAERFRGYGMETRTVDGNSVPAMDEAAKEAIARARSGGGPTFLECMTYRLGGHTFGSTTEYMDPEELSRAEADEPVARYRRWLLDHRGISEAVLRSIEIDAEAQVEAAVDAAKASDPPPADELLTDVFSTVGGAAPTMLQDRSDVPSHTMSEAINQAIDTAMAEDPEVFVMGEDIEDPIGGVMKGTKGLSTKYGRERVRNTPISEQAIVGAAIGASLVGMRPIAEVMLMDFFAVAMDQVANHAAKLRYMSGGRTNVPITIRTSVGGGRQFGAQHSQSLEAWMMHIPGLKVVVPSTPRDAKGLLYSCILDDDPCIFMETMSLLFTRGPVPAESFEIPLGVAEVKRAGDDVTVVTWGWQVPEALAAAEQLADDGISVEVIDLRTLVPLDTATILERVARTGRLLVVHAATQFAGPGAEIASMVSHELFGQLAAPVERLGAVCSPVPYASELEKSHYPERTRIVQRIQALAGYG